MEPPIIIQSWEASSYQISIGSHYGLLVVARFDSSRYTFDNTKNMLQISMELTQGGEVIHLGDMELYCIAQEIGRMGSQIASNIFTCIGCQIGMATPKAQKSVEICGHQ